MRTLIPFITRNGSAGQESRPLASVARLPLDLDQVIGRLLDDPWSFSTAVVGLDALRVDLEETENEVVVTAEIPGVDPKEVEVHIEGDTLVIAGEKKTQEERKNGGRTYSERTFGAFRREVALPFPVQADQVRAEHKHGVVTIHLPKAEAARSRRIEIQSS